MNRHALRAALALGFLAVTSSCQTASPTLPGPGQSAIRFEEVAASAGIRFPQGHGGKEPLTILETGGCGAAFLDFDRDGKLDILLVGASRCALFRQANDRFQDVTAASGLQGEGNWSGVAVGDVDNDGWPDLFLNGYRCHALLRNNRGRFVDITAAWKLPPQRAWGTSAAFFDADNDGWLDLATGQYVAFDESTPQYCHEAGEEITCSPNVYQAQRSRLYQNHRTSFQDVTSKAGFDASEGKTWSVVPFDYNDDGLTDLYAANDLQPADLWQNLGGWRFKNVGIASGTALSPRGAAQGGMGVDIGDVNGDGHLDLWCTTYEGEFKTLFRNLGTGSFDEIGRHTELITLKPLVSWGTIIEDFDLDGELDICVISGHVVTGKKDAGRSYPQLARLFRGLGGGRFADQSDGAGAAFSVSFVGRGLAAGDYDSDGRVDLLAANLEGEPLLLRNVSPTANSAWLQVDAISATGRPALGAKVELRGARRRWVEEVRTAAAVFSSSSPTLTFGLGDDPGPYEVIVRWPGGGRQILRVGTARQKLEMIQR